MVKYLLNDIKKIQFSFKLGDIVFLNWDLWSWKTTLSKHILNNILYVNESIISPTYKYYNKYTWILDWKKIDIYHFDLYRLENYDEFFAIAWEDILDNNSGIILIEWPELIKKYYNYNIEINLTKIDNENTRDINIKYK